MSPYLLSVVAAVVPTAVYVAFIYRIDRYEKEPLWLLTAAFVWGAVPSTILAFLFNFILDLPVYYLAGQATADWVGAVLIAPPVEEMLKGLMLFLIFQHWRHEIDSTLDGIIYGAMVGMGFAMVENVVYFVDAYNQQADGGLELVIFVRSLLFGLNHALYSSMTGLGIAVARLSPRAWVRLVAPIAGLLVAIALHTVHNLAATLGGMFLFVALANAWGGVLVTAVIVVWSIAQEGRWIREYLQEEVDLGVISAEQYQQACSALTRLQQRLRHLRASGPRGYRRANHFYYLCSELAYKKHHHALFADLASAEYVRRLRRELVEGAVGVL